MFSISDAVHKRIFLEDELLVKLLDTREVQRLRRISQLGGNSLAFPSSTHNRFSHSIGVTHIAQQISKKLNFTEKETRIVTCAALLHDIGHGPFSHAFEDVTKVNHEEISLQIIKGDSEVNKILKEAGLVDDVYEVIKGTHKNKKLVQTISSQVDADRLDYLARDSFFSGTQYGGFDTSWIINSMLVKDGSIYFEAKAQEALELFFIIRYQMFSLIYHHITGSKYEVLCEMIFNKIVELFNEGKLEESDLTVYKDIILDNKINYVNMHNYDDTSLISFIASLIKNENKELAKLCCDFLNRKLPAAKIFNKESEAVKFAKTNNAILRKRYKYLYKTSDKDSIRVVAKDGKVKKLEEVSKIISSLVTNCKRDEWVCYYYD